MKNLNKLKNIEANAPEGRQVQGTEAVAVALTTQCPYCIEIHSSGARDAGASDAELAETVLVAAALRADGAITHVTHALKT
jgi:AhpD family alkylhydroperoxidase